MSLTTSPEFNELAKAVSAAQRVIEPAMKGRTVEVHTREKGSYSYDYAELDDVWLSCREALGANGLAIFQPPTTEGALVTITTLLVHGASGQWIRMEMKLVAQGGTPQAIGSAITYGRRYSLMGMLGLVARGDDDDAKQAEERPRHETRTPVPQQEMRLTYEEIERKLAEATSTKLVMALVKRWVDPEADGNADHPLKVAARARYKALDTQEKAATSAAGGAA